MDLVELAKELELLKLALRTAAKLFSALIAGATAFTDGAKTVSVARAICWLRQRGGQREEGRSAEEEEDNDG